MARRTDEQRERLQATEELQERLEQEIDPDRETDVLGRYRRWFDAHIDEEAERDDGLPTDASLSDEYIERFIEVAADPTDWITNRQREDDIW